MGPVVAPAGTGTMIVSDAQVVGVAATPLKVIVPDVPRPIPLTVTYVPTGPETGLTPVISKLGTVKVTELLLLALSDTTTGPVVAPIGTIT
jgi:hypothetical protein